MNILFISSGNSTSGLSPIILNQGNSLVSIGNSVSYYSIKGKGLKGYLRNIKPLKKYLKENKFDIIHAHFVWCGIIASLAGAKPLVVSLMGSDVKGNLMNKLLSIVFIKLFWDKTVVKSEDMRRSLYISKVSVIPNGVDFNRFKPIDKNTAMAITKWDISKKHILFAGDPNRKVKNFKLAKEAFEKCSDMNLELHVLKNIDNKILPYYYSAADVVLLTSLWEGSPNVIKEAMACNRPIVSTNIGDVKEIIGNTKGCIITENNSEDCKHQLISALTFEKTNGRQDIFHLNSKLIAIKLVQLYQATINKISK